MAMTKKDYILLADILINRFNTLDSWTGAEGITARQEALTITEDLINALGAENPRFTRAQFIAYINKKTTGSGKLI